MQIHATDKTIIISLGQDCQAAWRLKQFNLREAAYPFDWLRSYDFKGVCATIEDRFMNFLNAGYLTVAREQVSNNVYNLGFVHDFPTNDAGYIAVENENCGMIVSNYLEYLNLVKKKYEPRIKRFLDALEGNNKVFFIRTHITPEQACYFTKIIDKIFPRADYTLIVIHENASLNYNWNIAQVQSFYIGMKEPLCVNGLLSVVEWEKIFKNLGLLGGQVKRTALSNSMFSSYMPD